MPFDPYNPSPIPGLPDTAWPTINQLAAIGAVVNAWSWLDLALQSLLCSLVQSDAHLSQALTEDLSPDNRLKALRRLARTLDKTFINLTGEQSAFIVELREIAKWVAVNKSRRNSIAHYIWLRSADEEIFGWKHSLAIPQDKRSRPNMTVAWRDLIAFSEEIGAMVARVNAALRTARAWPDWPGSWRKM